MTLSYNKFNVKRSEAKVSKRTYRSEIRTYLVQKRT